MSSFAVSHLRIWIILPFFDSKILCLFCSFDLDLFILFSQYVGHTFYSTNTFDHSERLEVIKMKRTKNKQINSKHILDIHHKPLYIFCKHLTNIQYFNINTRQFNGKQFPIQFIRNNVELRNNTCGVRFRAAQIWMQSYFNKIPYICCS